MSFHACLCVTLFVTVATLKIPKPEVRKRYVWSENGLEDGLVDYKGEYGWAEDVPTVAFSMKKPLKKIIMDKFAPKSKSVSNQDVEEDEESVGSSGNVVIHKQLKLALCYFPKVASAETNSMFNNMNGLDRDEIGSHVFGASSPKKMGVDVAEMTKENGWYFGFLTRDPLSRFLSAFGSKCLPKEDGTRGDVHYCGGTVGETEKDGWAVIDHPVEEEEAVQAFERHVVHFKEALYTSDGELKTNNKHYMRMTDIIENCGMDMFAPDKVDFIGHLMQQVHKQVKHFIYMGIERAGSEEHAATQVNKTEIDFFLDKFFPQNSVHGHSSTHDPAIFYRNKSIAAMVHRMYQQDYDSLGQVYPGDQEYYHGPRP